MSKTPFYQLNIFDYLEKQSKTLNIASMCSGIGTPEIAFHELGISTNLQFACEIDPFARKTFTANHKINEEDFYFDITNFDATKYLGLIDVLIFGSPCQPFSIAGYRKGFDDPRGKVFFDGIKRIDECKPQIVIFENVKGLISHNKGKTYKIVQQEFKKIGYTIKCNVFDSVEHDSFQKRKRLFIIAFRDSKKAAKFDFKDFAYRETINYFEDILEDEVDEKYFLGDVPKNYMWEDYNDKKRIKKGLQLKSRQEHLSVNNTSNRHVYTLTASYSKGYPHNVMIDERCCKHGFWTCDFVCTGMCEHCDIDNELNFQDNMLATPAYRKLTPRECARLQGIPDWFKIVVSDTQAYKQIGNSIEINLMKDILLRVCTLNFEGVLNV